MMKRLFTLAVAVVGMCSLTAMSAQVTLNGTVTDPDGAPLAGAAVYVKTAPTMGTVTDPQGNYSLEVNLAPPFTIQASFIGYATASLEINQPGDQVVNIQLGNDALGMNEVVVTGVSRPESKLESSVSITTLKPAAIDQASPRTTAEIFRNIPGIRSESSGGDGNTNITVRGVPISAGGSKYLQLQEDGLPILMFGDIAFATSDIFLRYDYNVARIEAIRGGSASTMASNSPAGIINFISKTGAVEGGSVGTTFGLDYNTYRTDFDYGAPIGNGLSFHVGGFFRQGEGPRSAGYTANNGGQFKANITKTFDNGYARVYYKHLNDRTAAYMPMPVQVSGTNADPNWESLDNFSATLGTPHSVFLSNNYGIGANGERRNVDVSDGMHPKTNAIGAEFMFDLEDGWQVKSKSRYSSNSGRFVAPFTAAVGTTSDMLGTIGGAIGQDLSDATLTYAHSGEAYDGELSQVIHMFDTELKNFNNLVSDNSISKSFGDMVEVQVGVFKGLQEINMAWLWNSYMMEVEGENAALIDIANAAGDTLYSTSGQFAYGVPVWGNCCQVEYNSQYEVTAPYASVGVSVNEQLSVDASVRFDVGRVRGVGHGTAVSALDVNNDGSIDQVEQEVAVVDHALKNPVSYDYDYVSYSLGANYLLNETNAVYARHSRGASAKADRAVFPTASYLTLGNPKDIIDQTELGWKSQFEKGALYVTGFYAATTEEGGFEATTQQVIENDYTAAGVEIEGVVALGDVDLRGACTYTNARIASGDNEGNTPRRQPDLMYSLMPTYSFGEHNVGLSIIGQTDAFAQDNNELVMPGYTVVNAFVSFNLAPGLYLGVNGNNLLDAIGITESEEGSIVENQVNYIRARSITGRSLTGSLRYNF